MKKLVTYVFAFLAWSATAVADDAPVVVELFTAQGCAACPPADQVIADINYSRDDVLVLSWSVDYWDYMGWEDTFAKPEHTQRQEEYNIHFAVKGVYTPQVIINGYMQTVGSRRAAVEGLIYDAKMDANPVDVSLRGDWSGLRIRIDDAKVETEYNIRLVWFDPERTVMINGGDNSGRSLHYTNVVRGSAIIGQWNGDDLRFEADPSVANASGARHFAILLEDVDTGRIIGATSYELPARTS